MVDVDDLSTFYKYAVDTIYAVILTFSFESAVPVLFPIQKIFTTHGAIDAAAVTLSYFVLVSGWIGYHRSVTNKPHKGRLGNVRFAIDLIIVFLVFYIVQLADPVATAPYSDTFTWAFPFLFVAYAAWDITKYFEYSDDIENYQKRARRTVQTALIGLAFWLVCVLYLVVIQPAIPYVKETWGNKNIFDIYGLGISFLIIWWYRFVFKWEVKSKKKSTGRRKNKPNIAAVKLDKFFKP